MPCPDLMTCGIPTTQHYYKSFCKSQWENGHEDCPHYCRRQGLMKRPVQWLQLEAVIQAGMRPHAETKT